MISEQQKCCQSSVFIYIHYLRVFKVLGSYYNIFLRTAVQHFDKCTNALIKTWFRKIVRWSEKTAEKQNYTYTISLSGEIKLITLFIRRVHFV